jgi:hypothetical protein
MKNEAGAKPAPSGQEEVMATVQVIATAALAIGSIVYYGAHIVLSLCDAGKDLREEVGNTVNKVLPIDFAKK